MQGFAAFSTEFGGLGWAVLRQLWQFCRLLLAVWSGRLAFQHGGGNCSWSGE